MSKKINHYLVLGVSKTSTSAEIKKSFQRLAMKYHPDRNKKNKDSGEKFKEIRKSYKVLIDAKKRSAYDNLKASGAGVDSKDSKYKGERKDNKKHGQGTYTWADGSKYVGEFKEGKNHGQGTYTWANGGKYVGEWKEGKKHGQGTHTFASGNKYVGEWRDDEQHGQGSYTYGEDSKWAGDKYIGESKDNKNHGQGTYTWANGNKYEGEWKDDKKHGQGTYTWADGSVKAGIWKNGVFTGRKSDKIKNQSYTTEEKSNQEQPKEPTKPSTTMVLVSGACLISSGLLIFWVEEGWISLFGLFAAIFFLCCLIAYLKQFTEST